MGLILEFLKSFLFEVIFVLIFSCGLFTLYITKVKNIINLKNVGINHIYKQGNNNTHMNKAIEESSQIKIIAFMPFSFIFNNKELLVKKIKEGCNIKFLIGKPDSLLLKEICQMERHSNNDISEQCPIVINLLNSIKFDAGNDATGTIEVRTYNTEIRNPAIICIKNRERKTAFVTVSMIPKQSIDNIMLEYKDDKCDSVITYFDAIWDRHSNDILLNLR